MRTLRILAIAPTSFFADYGCHVRVWGHLQALVQRGHEVRLITYPSGRDRPPVPTVRPRLLRRWPVQVGSSWKKLVLDMLLVPLVVQTARVFRPDVVHAFLHEGVALAQLLQVRGVPVVFDYQGSLTAEMLTHRFVSSRSPLLPFWRTVERLLDRRPHLIVASTRHAVMHLVHEVGLPSERVIYLPDSVDPRVFRPAGPQDTSRLNALRVRWRLSAERPVVAYLGLLAPYQGIDVLLAAFREVVLGWSGKGRPLLMVMGFPFVREYTRRAERLGIGEHVRFTGAVSYDEAPDYLRLARVAVAPKLPGSEGAGKLLPYMATALPVVASDTPVHRTYLGDEGYYARPGDAASLAQALRDALRDPEAMQRGRRLRARVEAQYTWEHAGHTLERAYQQVVAK